MDAAEEWQLEAAIAALSADGRTLARSLRTRLARIPNLRLRFQARTPAPRGELLIESDENEIARLLLKPGGLPKLSMGSDPPRELSGLSQAAEAAARVARRAQEIADAAPQLGLFGK